MPSILVAEDDRSVAEGLVTVLENAGHKVVLARTGPSAVAAAESAHFDALLTDIDLPGTDGYEVAQRVRAQHPDIRVLVLSGARTVDMRRLPPGTRVLHKPEKAEVIVDAVDAAMAA